MYADKLQLQKKTGRIERLFRLFFFETCFKKVILDPLSWGNEYKAFSDILSGPLTLFRPVFFFCASCGGGGRGRRSPAAAPITSKTLMIRPPKLHRIMFSSFPTSRHNLIGTVTLLNFVPPQSEKFLNSEVSIYCFVIQSCEPFLELPAHPWKHVCIGLIVTEKNWPVYKRMLRKHKKFASLKIPRETNTFKN